MVALYVNPILRLLKAALRPVQAAMRYYHNVKVLQHTPIYIVYLYIATHFVAKNLRKFLWLLGKLVWRFVKLIVNWRRVYVWHKRLWEARKLAKEDGREWRNRYYITGWLLDKWQKHRNHRKRDVEEQLTDDVSTELDTYRSSRMQSAAETPRENESEGSHSPRPKSEGAIGKKPVTDDGEEKARSQTW